MYDLHDKQALKTQEYVHGIVAVWAKKDNLAKVFAPYLAAIQEWNPQNDLHYYPGSPAIAAHILRKQDRLFLCEKHPQEYEQLQFFSKPYPRMHCSQQDGYYELLACLPPNEKRGVIMVDPSYEIKTEYALVAQKIQMAYHKFSQGIYCIWYPIIDKILHKRLLRGLSAIPASRSLCLDFYLNTKNAIGMDGCGLYIINQPYTLEQELRSLCDSLLDIFNPGQSSYTVHVMGS